MSICVLDVEDPFPQECWQPGLSPPAGVWRSFSGESDHLKIANPKDADIGVNFSTD